MRLLFLGDVVGRSGRQGVIRHLPELRKRLAIDFAVVNAENAAGGFGLTAGIVDEMLEAGADCLTTGNHVWDKREIIPRIAEDSRLLRPVNYPAGAPGRGAGFYVLPDGRSVLVINVMLRLFMDPLDDPFAAVEAQLADARLAETADFILIDAHGEATSEKMAFGHAFDGRASLVVGTHTHVPTADTMILTGGTAYQTDAGMCGDYNSVIGMKPEVPVERFVSKISPGRLEAADGEATVCGVLVETDDATGLAKSVDPIRVGGRLSRAMPLAMPLAMPG
ncbi:MAG: YmdB family metallophosphoesterase [Rhodospirillaceae bacterium]|jgi:2',3'-cyclic-nucleotide 2'-phosphodiesterase|nr:YmdB family metallophosphoesterase [Rhodospirillaceae bacterium]